MLHHKFGDSILHSKGPRGMRGSTMRSVTRKLNPLSTTSSIQSSTQYIAAGTSSTLHRLSAYRAEHGVHLPSPSLQHTLYIVPSSTYSSQSTKLQHTVHHYGTSSKLNSSSTASSIQKSMQNCMQNMTSSLTPRLPQHLQYTHHTTRPSWPPGHSACAQVPPTPPVQHLRLPRHNEHPPAQLLPLPVCRAV